MEFVSLHLSPVYGQTAHDPQGKCHVIVGFLVYVRGLVCTAKSFIFLLLLNAKRGLGSVLFPTFRICQFLLIIFLIVSDRPSSSGDECLRIPLGDQPVAETC